jgi:hypothetical protein
VQGQHALLPLRVGLTEGLLSRRQGGIIQVAEQIVGGIPGLGGGVPHDHMQTNTKP